VSSVLVRRAMMLRIEDAAVTSKGSGTLEEDARQGDVYFNRQLHDCT
jgi:hypothetical protein